MTDEESIDIIAYMLSVGPMPAGDDDLRTDRQILARTIIQQRP